MSANTWYSHPCRWCRELVLGPNVLCDRCATAITTMTVQIIAAGRSKPIPAALEDPWD